jgi:hypothetical protein
MTDAFTRGTAPGRARDASQRPGSFKPGHAKVGGRKKGTPNALSVDYKNAVLAAAYFVGRDGKGADGLVGYSRILSKEQNDKEVRDLIGVNKTGSGSPEPALTTEWPIPDLMRMAVKYPGEFGKLFAAMVPVPRGRPRRPSWESMTSEPTSAVERALAIYEP